jgi:hypothetical protein
MFILIPKSESTKLVSECPDLATPEGVSRDRKLLTTGTNVITSYSSTVNVGSKGMPPEQTRGQSPTCRGSEDKYARRSVLFFTLEQKL